MLTLNLLNWPQLQAQTEHKEAVKLELQSYHISLIMPENCKSTSHSRC